MSQTNSDKEKQKEKKKKVAKKICVRDVLFGNTKKDPKLQQINKDLQATPKSKANLGNEEDILEAILKEAERNSTGIKNIKDTPFDRSQFYRGSTNILTAGARLEYTADMVLELKKCSDDILYFAENYFFIVNLNKGKKEKIKLFDAQKNALLTMRDNKRVVLLASRQSGKSTLLTIFALWLACFSNDQTIVLIANKESTALNIFKRIRMAYEQIPLFLKPGVKDYGKTGFTLANDSTVFVSTTTATSIRGLSISCLLLDELAFIGQEIVEEFWSSVIPTVSSSKNAKIFIASTPNGTQNKFYEIYSGAERKENGWIACRINWSDVPGRDEQWKIDQIHILGSEEKFDQEFGNVFIDPSITAISSAAIERFKRNKKEPIAIFENGDYIVYENPNPEKLYVVGVDVAEGIGRASSVAQVLDITDLQDIKQVAVYGSSIIEPFFFAAKLNILLGQWGKPPVLIERNNCGAQTIDALFYTHSYDKIVSFNKISENNRHIKTRNMGVLSHTNIRFTGIQNLRYWINHLGVVSINDPKTISEFETFVRKPNGVYSKRTPERDFDDRVLALTWALFILEPTTVSNWFEVLEFDALGKPLKIKRSIDFDPEPPSTYVVGELVFHNEDDENGRSSDDENMGFFFNDNYTENIEEVDTDLWNPTTKTNKTLEDDLTLDELLAQGYQFWNK